MISSTLLLSGWEGMRGLLHTHTHTTYTFIYLHGVASRTLTDHTRVVSVDDGPWVSGAIIANVFIFV